MRSLSADGEPLLEILSRTPFPSILFPVGQREDAVWLWQRPSEIGEPDAWGHWGYTVTLSTQKGKGDPFNYSNTHTTLVSEELSCRPTSQDIISTTLLSATKKLSKEMVLVCDISFLSRVYPVKTYEQHIWLATGTVVVLRGRNVGFANDCWITMVLVTHNKGVGKTAQTDWNHAGFTQLWCIAAWLQRS